MLRILNVEPDQYSDDARSILRGVGEVIEKNMDRAELMDCIGGFDILVVRLGHQVDAELLSAAPRLKAIVSATTGLDHIDMEFASRRDIAVLSLRGELEFLRTIPATAEHTWGLLLALLRNIPWAHSSVLRGEWRRDRFKGRELQGRRLGVLGLGRIGEKIASYGLAFGMLVNAFDPYGKSAPAGVAMKDSLEILLQVSDVFSIHVPLNPETEKMIGIKEIYNLPRGSYFINTSRGAVVDEAALLDALQSGHLAGAALDVLTGERTNESMPLIEYARAHSNLLLTPHIGGATHESMQATEIFMAKKLASFLGASGRDRTKREMA
jgi:D-3-phosphoglycerate dehydrogenase